MTVKNVARVTGNTSVGHSPASASWVGSSDTDSSLDRKLRMALKACGVARGRAGASKFPVSLPGQLRPRYPPEPQLQGPAPAVPHLVPHGSLRIHGEAAEHRQDLVGAIIHRVEVVGGGEAQNTRDPGRCKWVLSGPAKGGGEDPVSGLGWGGKRAPECRVSTGPRTVRPYFPEQRPSTGPPESKKCELITNKWGEFT